LLSGGGSVGQMLSVELGSGVGTVAIHQLENGTSQPRRATLDVIKRAFETAGVEFIEENSGGPGARRKRRSAPTFSWRL
jgi:hypothetical protein